jgi:hypothetical protein
VATIKDTNRLPGDTIDACDLEDLAGWILVRRSCQSDLEERTKTMVGKRTRPVAVATVASAQPVTLTTR